MEQSTQSIENFSDIIIIQGRSVMTKEDHIKAAISWIAPNTPPESWLKQLREELLTKGTMHILPGSPGKSTVYSDYVKALGILPTILSQDKLKP